MWGFFVFCFFLEAATCVKIGIWGCKEHIQEISVKYNRSCQTLSRGQTKVTIMCLVWAGGPCAAAESAGGSSRLSYIAKCHFATLYPVSCQTAVK